MFIHDDDKPSDNQKLKYREKYEKKKTKCNRDTLTHRAKEWSGGHGGRYTIHEFHHDYMLRCYYCCFSFLLRFAVAARTIRAYARTYHIV